MGGIWSEFKLTQIARGYQNRTLFHKHHPKLVVA
jgi:hypothetical protein